jgi:NAD(P)-dependent dehydrogenase (short-subunit alcohol dehydrogenase family)
MASDRFDIAGKVALVTGAASGIGLAIAEAMAEAGAKVMLLDIDRAGLEAAGERLRQAGAAAIVRAVDVADRAALRVAIDSVAAHFGGLDIAFSNAGIGGKPGYRGFDGTINHDGLIENVLDEDWDRMIAINLGAAFTTIQRAALHMKKRGGGRIVVTTSVAAFRAQAWVGTPYMPAKAGAAHLVRQMALELASHNITVNAIAPGAFATNIGGGRLKRPEVNRAIGQRIPLGRVAAPEEIKGLALFLASSASGFITGAEIPIDGGSSLGG